jgi:hypothetical protein
MSLKNEKISLQNVAKQVFEEAITTALGSSCSVVIEFHLKQKFGKDPYEVFLEDPKSFYEALEEIFEAGAESMISLVGTFLVKKYGITCEATEFLNLVVNGDEPAKRALKEILTSIAPNRRSDRAQ